MINKDYLPRLIDDKFDKYLSVFGAISVEGPKWCGKTWTSLNHAKSAVLNLNADKLLKDLNTFGFMFESLVERS